MDQALAEGVEVVGGIDPAGMDGDPVRHLEVVFDLAVRHGVRVDLHLHDEGSLGTWELELICDFTERYGLAGRVAVSHAYGLGEASPAEQDRLAKRLAEAGVSITTAAVYSFPVAPVRRLRVAGVTVACGHDGIRDLWGLLRNRRHEWISARARVIQPPGDYIWLDAINAPKVTNPWFLRLCGPAS